MIAVVGFGVWLASLFLLPAPLAARITLGAPLVLAPALLAIHPAGMWARRAGGPVALAAALPLLIAFALPAGPAGAAFALPWLVFCLTVACAAAWHGLVRLPGILDPRRGVELGAYLALAFLAAGAAFLLSDRLGFRPLNISTAIILLTATHFHFAGFGLMTVACLLGRRRPALRGPILGLAFGIPFTAVGFVLASDALNALGASVVGLSGLGVAAALLTTPDDGPHRWLQRAAGTAMSIGFPMGIAWAWSIWLGIGFIDLDLMVRTHGVLNASGVLIATFALRDQRA